ncbi:hypothetical protein KP509_07G057500 [Ceratopteris richardii]|uniref:RING-type E3 ubiquitin transferase n=1 Tax=Ceratopteris richardii TaxID=49495 RepID=A0A8T2UB75_CERRI|nr:hypothetical protein KP509_07G057500 [Ceratopteris richardii]
MQGSTQAKIHRDRRNVTYAETLSFVACNDRSAEGEGGTRVYADTPCLRTQQNPLLALVMYYYTQQGPRRVLLQETATFFIAASPGSPSDNDEQQYPNDSFDVSGRFSPSMAIILVILLTSFIFMAFFSIYVRRCSDGVEDAPRARGGAEQGGANEPPLQGVDPTFLEKLPLVAYSSSMKKGSIVECVVCLTDFEEGETLCQLPKCKHVFHKDCIHMWLLTHTTCPLCRRSLISGSTRSFRWGIGSGSLSLSLARRGSGRGSEAGTGPPSPTEARPPNEAELANLDQYRRSRMRRSHSTGHSFLKQVQGVDGRLAIAELPDLEEARSSDADSEAGGRFLPIAPTAQFQRSRSYAASGVGVRSTYAGISTWMRGAGASFKRALSMKKGNSAATSSSSATAAEGGSFQRMDAAIW